MPFAIASQYADGTSETLGIECQKGQDVMVGVLLDENKSGNALYPARDVEFRVGMNAPIRLKIAPEATAQKGPIYSVRLSDRPEDADRLLVALLSQQGDVVVTMAAPPGGSPRTMIFRDDEREAAIIATLRSCGIDINKVRGQSDRDLSARLEGIWAHDRKACRLYQSGELDKPKYDTATSSRFGVATFHNGYFEMWAEPIRCQLSQTGNPARGKYTVSAECQVKDYPKRTSTGAVSFGPSGSLHLDLRSGDFGEINFVKCD
ncbi:hypothetical protein [Xanthobacter sediminis]|uniref:hypothetical protein n=1 Tax=Xanthobacter sediminis TaxID=3119926 RepID=UPI003726C7B1